MDRERREHEREERMGQLRGSATRALPPGPPAGATANRLRNVAEPMASTPTSRIQQSGEWTENGMQAFSGSRSIASHADLLCISALSFHPKS